MKQSISYFLLLVFKLVQSGVIPTKPLVNSDDDEEPFSSNKSPEAAYVASLANNAYRSIVSSTTCSSLGINSDLCDTIRSTHPSKMNIYWARSDNKTELRVSSSNGQPIIGSEHRSVLAIKPISTAPSPVFIFLIGNPFEQTTCLKDHGKIIDHGQGRCLILCIQRYKFINPARSSLCTSSSLPLAHFAQVNHESRNLIKCVDGILGAAPC